MQSATQIKGFWEVRKNKESKLAGRSLSIVLSKGDEENQFLWSDVPVV
jgi:hypothetical protein